MQVPFIDLKKEYSLLKPEIDSAIKKAVADADFILGRPVAAFEKKISEYLGVRALGCASGSDALLLAMMALNIKAGDEVITTPFTFAATATGIARLGAKPVFVDIDENSYNIDYKLIEKAVTKKTKAIIIVHLFGNPAEMAGILAIAKKYKLAVIEDACQAIGAEYKGKKAGSLGDFGCFSFFPTKNLGGYGDGGLITCKSKRHYDLLKKLRAHGSAEKYYHDIIGINSRLDSLQAAVLNVKIDYLDERNNRRIKLAEKYNASLKNIVATPLIDKKNKHVFHQYAVLVKNRGELINYLKANGIAAGVYYPLPLHLQKCFSYLGYKKGDFPIAEKVSETIISLPIFPLMSREESDYVIKTFLKKYDFHG